MPPIRPRASTALQRTSRTRSGSGSALAVGSNSCTRTGRVSPMAPSLDWKDRFNSLLTSTKASLGDEPSAFSLQPTIKQEVCEMESEPPMVMTEEQGDVDLMTIPTAADSPFPWTPINQGTPSSDLDRPYIKEEEDEDEMDLYTIPWLRILLRLKTDPQIAVLSSRMSRRLKAYTVCSPFERPWGHRLLLTNTISPRKISWTRSTESGTACQALDPEWE
jgi:hypothetical protein